MQCLQKQVKWRGIPISLDTKSCTCKITGKCYRQRSTRHPSKSEVKIERENQENEKKKISKHLVRSSAASSQGSTTASATLPSDLTEQEANSNSSATWVHHVSHSQRQYHVDGQGNVWYAADMCGITQGVSALPIAHVLPGPVSVPENNTLNGSSAPVWTWDATEGILTSDMGNVPVVGASIASRSGSELTESIYGIGQMDMHYMQVIGGMPYEAVTANPEIQYHQGGLAHQQVSPAWFPHSLQGVSYHSSSGSGVYWPQMDVGGVMQTHGRTGPVVGAGHPGYQLMPVAAPDAAYTGSTMVSMGHSLAAWT